MVAASCSLEENSSSFVSPDDFYTTYEECQAGVNGCYQTLNGIFTKDMMIGIEGTTDLLYVPGSGTQDAQLNISPANARFGAILWKQAYTGVRNCNMCVEGIAASPISVEKKAPLLAEAKAMRAFYYYLLTSTFGDVPFYKDVIRTEADVTRIEHLPRMSAYETRADLIRELQDCVADLPQGRSLDVAHQRAGSSFVYMLIAKMALWNKDWDSALSALLSLKGFYGDLTEAKYPLSDIPFGMKNTPESIFEIQHTFTAGGLDVGTTLASYMMPGRRESGTSKYDGVEIPEMGDKSTCYTSFRPNKYFYQSIMPRTGNDKRMNDIMRWEWNGVQFASCASRPWMGPKFWCFNMVQTNDSNNYPVFRYADAVLMLAEVYNELEEPTLAIACLNQVKARAGIDLYTTFRTKAGLLEEIQRERARELVGEFQRKYDLVRWGIWYRETWNNNDYTALLNNILPCHEYYPIPDSECGLSGGNLKNEAYEKYLGSK